MAVTLHIDGSAFPLAGAHGSALDIISEFDRYESDNARVARFLLANGEHLYVRLGEQFRYQVTGD